MAETDWISRQAAIDALWKALYEYEDKTEKQFIDSEELDVADWIQHRIFVQNMSDIDRQTILGLPSAQLDLDEWCTDCKEYDQEHHCCPRWNRVIRQTLQDAQPEVAKRIVGMSRDGMTMWYQCDMCNEPVDVKDAFCSGCGRRLMDE